MYLKSLELFGFKSFAAKTVLNFHRGVTAIVGPNGCGKSNVLDAIRWVLGEQSAKALRGGEMADVIFSGTDSRQPVNMAEVSLTFEDCEKDLGVEWNEVRLTRRVFRDGKSEYLLNKTPCRLKDIQQLFMDTGVGRTAYSIMEQGKIDQILSSRPEDRRAVFEEAAGITKYKTQKKEALRKLEYTEANLVRITDIIKEVKRQIGSLQRQAGKARRYQALLQDLKALETALSKRNYDELNRQLEETLDSVTKLREQYTQQEEAIDRRESSLSGQRREIEEIERQIATIRQQVFETKSQIATSENRIAFNHERITESQSLLERYQRDIAGSEEKLQFQKSQIQETGTRLEQLMLGLQTEETKLQEETGRTAGLRERRREVQQQLEHSIRQSNEAESSIVRCRAELSGALVQRESGETRLRQIQEELQRIEEEHTRLSGLISENSTSVGTGKHNLERLREELRVAENQLTDIRARQEQVSKEWNESQRVATETTSKLEVLRGLNIEGEGLNAGAQAVLRGLDNPDFYKPAILGALVAQINVRADYISAIEAALGQVLQAIVVKDAMVAEAILKTLSEKKLGRASITATEWMPQTFSVQMEMLPEGALCRALDCIEEIPSSVSPLLHQLLNHFIITDNLETALRLRRDNPHLAIATLAGEIVTAEGVIHGGRAGEAGSSLLQRKVQIATLEKEAAVHGETLQHLKNELAKINEQVEFQANLTDSLRKEMQEAQVALSTLEGQQTLLQRDMRGVDGKRETLNWEQAGLQEKLHEIIGKFTELESQITEKQTVLEEVLQQRNLLHSETTELQHQEEQLTSALNDLRVTVATSRQQRENLEREQRPMQTRVQELTELIAQRRQDIEGYETRIQTLKTESETLTQSIETLRQQVAQTESEAGAIVEKRTMLANVLQEVETELRNARKELTTLQEQRNQKEIIQSKIAMRIEHLLGHVQQRYQLDIRTFSPDYYAFHCAVRDQKKARERRSGDREATANEESPAQENADAETVVHAEDSTENAEVAVDTNHEAIDWEFVETLVREMSEKLDSMGPINMDAIQEYDELEERYRFLEEQFNDLTNSKAELLDVISKINTTTRTLFADTFEQVRINFQEMFTELFGAGAKANLLLADESDPLESGIEIIAKPPGKQLQSITLLSGGEKTMTAVALLFSIYMVKPSPFCVLDEMDAPLDESNINRFIKILDRFVGQSQFVVITHNKRTISKADVLYGVTMEEHGVSKLVGVKLTRSEEGESSEKQSIAESFGKSGNLYSEEINEETTTDVQV